MNTENIDFNIEALKARITVLEDFIKAKHPDFPTTPKGTSGTLTPKEDEIIGLVVASGNFANVREKPQYSSPIKGEIPHFIQGVPMEYDVYGLESDADNRINVTTGRPYIWYKLFSGYVREDVVTFTPDKPAPITPINASTWPMPISGYTVTNTHHNHRQHVGIDLAAPIGTKIYSAPNEGYVMKAFRCVPCGDDPAKQMHLGTGESDYGYGLGNYVVVRYYQHPAENKGHFLFVLYAHLSRINVQEKAALPPYTVIGEVGTSGNSTGPHLHIECRYSDNPLAEFYSIRANEIDPSTIFKA
jgi:murein DD-endopeptidase MepM/ murein hydrolase activator NlpD